jgi:hypothetical protein
VSPTSGVERTTLEPSDHGESQLSLAPDQGEDPAGAPERGAGPPAVP